MEKKYPSNEMFVLEEDGTRSDAALHEEILGGLSESAEREMCDRAVALAIAQLGITRAEAEASWGYQTRKSCSK